MSKYVTYHRSYKYIKNDKSVVLLTQLYKIGVYCIVNDDPNMQFGCKPAHLVNLEKKFKLAEKKGEITNLEFGIPITVTDKSGFWEEVKDIPIKARIL